MEPEVSILIVGYRNRRHLEACIGGALRSADGIASEVLFIDCSDDGSEAFVRERFPAVRVIPSQGNLGFGGGNNLLADLACGRLLLLLNPDTVPQADEVARLVRFAQERSEGGAWGGRCVRPDGSPDLGSHQPMLTPGGMLLTALGLARLRRGALPLGSRTARRVPVISGAFLLTTLALWNELGGFDPSFFLYAEETDLCRRIGATGRPLLADPSITLVHDAGSGDPDNPARRLNLLKGNATFFRKHHGPVSAWIGLASMALNEALRLAGATTILRLKGAPRAASLAARSAHALRHRSDWWAGWPRRRTA